MSAANPLLNPQTGANTAFPAGGFNASEMDQFVLCVGGVNALGAAEVVNVWILNAQSAQQALYNPATGTQYQLTNVAGVQAITLPGGYLYQFSKTATTLAVGVDVLTKPRAGGAGG